ncbi:energy transducer TonB [Aquimarina pacifica]|uniref:hypothetical protein n=1 Tax=Aquimarina pacifica TaxID=1296415 RepID=UPI0004728CE3|nr:hypothetical protein [Aquimarina pacifica]
MKIYIKRLLVLSIVITSCYVGFPSEGIKSKKINENLKKEAKETIPFEEVEVPPVFQKCLGFSQYCEQRNCVDKKIIDAIQVGLSRLAKKDSMAIMGKMKIEIQLMIDTDGTLMVSDVSGGNTKIRDAVYEVLSHTPNMKPGEQDGVRVNVLYTKGFNLLGKKKIDAMSSKYKYDVHVSEDRSNNKMDHDKLIPFQFSFCKKSEKYDAQFKKCMSKQIVKFVRKNFDKKMVDNAGIHGENKIFVRFKISECGGVTDIRARAHHQKLEEEACRIINLLSQYVIGSAIYDEKPVDMLYALPIVLDN